MHKWRHPNFWNLWPPPTPCQNWSYLLIPPLYWRGHIWTNPPPIAKSNQFVFYSEYFQDGTIEQWSSECWFKKAVRVRILAERCHIDKDEDGILASKYDVRIPLVPPPPHHIWSDFKLPPPSPLQQTSFVHAPKLWLSCCLNHICFAHFKKTIWDSKSISNTIPEEPERYHVPKIIYKRYWSACRLGILVQQ